MRKTLIAALAALGSRCSRRSAAARTGRSCCAAVAAATRLAPGAGTVALLVIGIGSTGFDGASEGPLFNGVRPELQDFFTSLGATLAVGLDARLRRRAAGRDRHGGRAVAARHRGHAAGGCRWPRPQGAQPRVRAR